VDYPQRAEVCVTRAEYDAALAEIDRLRHLVAALWLALLKSRAEANRGPR
jgi:hypothetical protein